MAIFGSAEWLQAFHEAINASKSYEEAAKTWEGDFYFVVEPEASQTEPVYYYVDLWHGKSRRAFIVKDESEMQPEFVISAPPSVWRKVIEKKLDPIQGLVTRQLKLKGNMGKIMRAVKAAQELVNCTTKVPTEFPA
ncbi:MAG: SCP2 sterol-binding domain-containing protein [Chloroflexi bacterium]|nr:SCP2 sterol-binding domain-containing protein [Chloroflexota bacterium]